MDDLDEYLRQDIPATVEAFAGAELVAEGSVYTLQMVENQPARLQQGGEVAVRTGTVIGRSAPYAMHQYETLAVGTLIESVFRRRDETSAVFELQIERSGVEEQETAEADESTETADLDPDLDPRRPARPTVVQQTPASTSTLQANTTVVVPTGKTVIAGAAGDSGRTVVVLLDMTYVVPENDPANLDQLSPVSTQRDE